MNNLLRARVVVTTALMTIVAVAAGDIFDRRLWWILLAPVVVGIAGITTLTQRWPVRVATAAASVVASTAIVVVVTGGTGADVATAFVGGPQRILSTDWPSPNRGELIGVVTAGLAIAAAFAAELARRTRLHLAPLLPILTAAVCVVALSAPLGLRLRWTLPIGALAIVLAALRPSDGSGLRERLSLLRGERRLVVVSALAIGLATAASIPIAFVGRDDPRRNEPAERSAAVLDPIEATLALQAIDPPIDLHEIDITAQSDALDGRIPGLWRTAALAEYDGRRWAPDLTLRPIGRRLDAAADDTIDATISFLDDDLQLVPLPGAPVVVDADVETDPERTLVRLAQRPDADTSIAVTARVAPMIDDADPGAVGTREVGERAGGLTDLAAGLADTGSEPTDDIITRLRAIESTMRNDFILRSDASGGGLQQTLIERFLRDTQRGNAEQFSAAFVLLARSLGVDARVATGFEVDRVGVDDRSFTLQSDDARIWPEILVADQWVAFDPVPEEEASDAIPPPPEPQVQTPAAPQPPIALPPESADEPIVTADDATTDTDASLPTVVTYAIVSVGVAAGLLIPILVIITAILGVKWRRRRRLLNTGSPTDRINGAWSVATLRLVDAGLTFRAADTNDDIATAGAAEVPTAEREIRRLAELSGAATFGSPARPDLLAEDAAGCLGQVETSMVKSRNRRDQLRWHLNLRSLRRSTTSPV